MAASGVDALRREPWAYDVLAAVQLLEDAATRAYADGTDPARQASARSGFAPRPVGEAADPAREAVSFVGSLDGAFPASDIVRLERLARPATVVSGSPPAGGSGEDARCRLVVGFLRLAGPGGPLPDAWRDLVAARLRGGDPSAREFLALFEHRLISIFVRLRRLRHPTHAGLPLCEAPVGRALLALLGLGTGGLREAAGRSRTGGLDRALTGHAGLLGRQPIGLDALARATALQFDVAVRAVPFRGRWVALDAADRTAIGKGGLSAALGRGAALGRRAWDQGAGITLRLGPLGRSAHDAFLASGTAHGPLSRFVRLATNGRFAIGLALELEPGSVEAARLDSPRARLGWGACLGAWRQARPAVTRLALDGASWPPHACDRTGIRGEA